MSFTDDDLSDYKYKLKNVWAFKSDREKMEALLARLECAERIVRYVKKYAPRGVRKLDDLINSWEKYAGKDME